LYSYTIANKLIPVLQLLLKNMMK